jgi:hypothetical protein
LLASLAVDAVSGTGALAFFFVLTRPEISFADEVASASFAFCVAASAPRRPPRRPLKSEGSISSGVCFVGSVLRSVI